MRETLARLLAIGTLVPLPWLVGCGGSDVKKCADLSCAQHQVCREASGDENAKCLAECESGFVWNTTTSSCDPAGATCAELDCESQGRVCLNNPTGAQCGTCLDGWRVEGTDCVQMTSCDPIPAQGISILNECGGKGRECVELVPGEAECGDCLQASHVVDPDTDACRNPLTCDDITCEAPNPPVCIQHPGEDAYCSDNCQGPLGEPGIVNSSGVCILCPACDDTANGEDGPFLGDLTGEGRCICETANGYYWQEGEPTGVTPCDRDGDGWVRFSAKAALDAASPVVVERAHCDFREIEAFELHNEEGDTLRVPVSPTVLMFESDRNDDQDILAQELATGATHIANLSAGRPPLPEELNSLTKYCVTELGDFNHNEIEDVDEWHGATTPVHPVFQPLLNWTYFAELHRGWFEFGKSPPRGTYHIEEKSRDTLAEAGWKVPFVRQVDGNDYWRSCARKRDSDFAGGRTQNFQTLDFGTYYRAPNGSGGEFSGMTHHSQFKCHKILTSLEIDSPPHHITKELLDNDPECDSVELSGAERQACLPRVNNCTAATTSGPDASWNAFNPSSADMTCTMAVQAPAAPAIAWVAYGYYDYPRGGNDPPFPRTSYIRSCVDECEETFENCPTCTQTWETCPGSSLPGATCQQNTLDYGVRQCGCGTQWGGAGCDVVCPHSPVMLDPLHDPDPFPIAPREEGLYWLCGTLTGTVYDDGSQPRFHENDPPDTGYVADGAIILSRPTAEWSCQALDCSTGYILK